jgi:hypothetical protein
VRERIYEGVVAAGLTDVRPVHVTLFRWPGPDGMRPTDLATAPVSPIRTTAALAPSASPSAAAGCTGQRSRGLRSEA